MVGILRTGALVEDGGMGQRELEEGRVAEGVPEAGLQVGEGWVHELALE